MDANNAKAAIFALADEIEHATNWWNQAIDKLQSASTAEYKSEVTSLLKSEAKKMQRRTVDIRALGDGCSTEVRARLYNAATKLKASADWEGVPKLLNEAAALVDGGSNPPLTKEAAAVLRFLSDEHPVLQTLDDIEGGAKISRARAQSAVTELEAANYAHRPHGRKKGATATDAGLAVNSKLSPNSAQT